MGAEEEATDDDPTPRTTDPRSIRPTMKGRRDLEMDAFGWIMFVILIILLIPLLPVIVLVVVLSRLLGLGGRHRFSWR